jgi:hypothetical protein
MKKGSAPLRSLDDIGNISTFPTFYAVTRLQINLNTSGYL